MPIVVTCPSCSATLKAPDTAAGRKLKCPKCTSVIEVPAAAPPPEEVIEDLPPAAMQADVPPPRSAPRADIAPRDAAYDGGGAGAAPPGQISRQTVGIVAIWGGALGLHKFVLGKNTAGIITLVLSFVCCLSGVMAIIGMIEGVKYLRMSDAEFYDTYVAGDKAWL